MRKLLATISSAGLLLFAFAGVASANTGHVTGSEDCDTFIVHVFLANNVEFDRTVIVETTILGTTGIAGNHYDTTDNPGDFEILTLSGPAPATGTVTLTIKNGSDVEATSSVSISPKEDCTPPSVEQSIPASVEQSIAASVEQSIPASVQQSIAASVEQSIKAATGTPAPSTPNTSLFGNGSSPLPTIIFGVVLLTSLTTLVFATVKNARSGRPTR